MVETREMKVNASELKVDESKIVEKLADFLKEKTGGDVTTEGKTVTVKGQGEALSKKYVRIIVKKFLHKHELSDEFKVIGAEETLKIKERKFSDEED